MNGHRNEHGSSPWLSSHSHLVSGLRLYLLYVSFRVLCCLSVQSIPHLCHGQGTNCVPYEGTWIIRNEGRHISIVAAAAAVSPYPSLGSFLKYLLSPIMFLTAGLLNVGSRHRKLIYVACEYRSYKSC